ncbi:MAG: hypothetical protein AAF004_10505 [Pseudomonadota bacterium]
MKFILTFFLGFIPAALLTLFALLANPIFDSSNELTLKSPGLSIPVAGTAVEPVVLGESGYHWMAPSPADTAPPDVHGMRSAFSVSLASIDGNTSVAYVVRMHAVSPEGKPLLGKMIDRSTWHAIIPKRGTFIIDANDNLWGFARRMMFTMLRGEIWRGDIEYVTTDGPVGAYARVRGITGTFAGQTGRAQMRKRVQEASMARGITRRETVIFVDIDETAPVAAEQANP